MATDSEKPWRLPGSVKGRDVRLDTSPTRSLSPSIKDHLRRIVKRTPEVMVKVTGRSRGGAKQLKSHLDYITRNGRLQAETQDGLRITDRAGLRALNDDWLLANTAESRGRSDPTATQSVAIILSMPPGSPPDRVEAAARTWARETFGNHYDWLMARHDDTDHPHVHVTVRAVGKNGLRLAPGPQDLQLWRERFAHELRRLGVEAEATPRQARGIVRKSTRLPIYKAEGRGVEPRVRRSERQQAERDASHQDPLPVSQWSRHIQERQENIRHAYLQRADELASGDASDQQLGRDIHRFVADMPVPLTRRQAMTVALREVLDKHPGRGSPMTGQAPTLPERSRTRTSNNIGDSIRQNDSQPTHSPRPKGRS